MSEPFVGEIKIFAGNFAPRGWAFCDGQLLAVSQNDALFSLLGTIYGGDGRTTFGLPDLRGRIPIHLGTGPGLSPRNQGARTGVESVSLTVNQLAPHAHGSSTVTVDSADSEIPADNLLAYTDNFDLYSPAPANTALSTNSSSSSGANQPHNNMMPYLCVNFIIALVGIYPSRS